MSPIQHSRCNSIQCATCSPGLAVGHQRTVAVPPIAPAEPPPAALRFLTPTALEEAVGSVLDEHVGWQMHRGFMVEGVVKAVAEHLTSEPALAAFREAWEQADAEGTKGDRVRRGMAAAIEAVS